MYVQLWTKRQLLAHVRYTFAAMRFRHKSVGRGLEPSTASRSSPGAPLASQHERVQPPGGPGEGAPPNNLLRALHQDDLALLSPHLETQAVEVGRVLYEPGDQVRHVYFPCGPTLISFMVLLEDGRGVETALVGREGAVGGIVSQGRLPAYARAVVQFPGPMLRIDSAQLERAKAQSS